MSNEETDVTRTTPPMMSKAWPEGHQDGAASAATPVEPATPSAAAPAPTAPADPARPVMVAGDPQWRCAEARMAEGIPVGAGLLNQVRQIAQAAGAVWLLD